MDTTPQEYVLTVVQHTYCPDCMWLKGKITDTYHASGIVRGDDSKHWRMQILSPPWEREARAKEFPSGFETVDVPALKLEIDQHIELSTQNPALISEILVKLKWMLMNRRSNDQVVTELRAIAEHWVDATDPAVCLASSR